MTDVALRVVGEEQGANEILQQIAKSLENVDKNTQKATKSTKEQADAGKTLKQSWTELNNMFGVAEKAYQTLKQAYAATVGDYLAQADAVRSLALATGAGSEETSRMIQVFDDAGVKAEGLKTAMLALNDAGIEPSIDSIANLSDEYRALKTPLEKNTFLTEKFGNRGIELGKVFEKTGKQIRDAGAAIDEGLIFDDEKIRAAEELRIATDNLNDSWQSLKNEAITPSIPVLAKFLSYTADFVAQYKEADNIITKNIASFKYLTGQSNDARIAAENLTFANELLNQTFYDGKKATDDFTGALNNTPGFDSYNDAIGNVEDALRDQEQAAKDAQTANENMFDALDTGLSGTIENLIEKIEFMKNGGADLQKAFADAYAEFLKDPGSPEAQARIKEMYAASQALEVTLGNIDGATAAKNIADTLGISLEDAYMVLSDLKNDLAKGASLVVNVSYNDPGWQGGRIPEVPKAPPPTTGDPGNPGAPTPPGDPVGANSVGFGAQSSTPTSSNGITIIVNAAQGQSAVEIANQVANILSQRAEQNRRSGSGSF